MNLLPLVNLLQPQVNGKYVMTYAMLSKKKKKKSYTSKTKQSNFLAHQT